MTLLCCCRLLQALEPRLSHASLRLCFHRDQVIERLFRERWGKYDGLGALVLTPTRELALQIFDELRKVCKASCLHPLTRPATTS